MKYIDIELNGINTNDYPDFCDAFISSANVLLDNEDIREATEKELDELNQDSSYVYDLVVERIF
jgi:hypothetical protein